MRAGNLRHRITVESYTEAQDPSTGAITPTWSAFASDVPADIVPLSGREILAAAAVDSGTRVRFVIRYGNSVGLTPAMRIVHDGATYNITEIVPDPSLRGHVTIMAEAGIRG